MYRDVAGYWKICRVGSGASETGWNQSQKEKVTTGVHSSHPHPLSSSDRHSAWRCDVCSDKVAALMRFRCTEGCDYDVCAMCWSEGVDETETEMLMRKLPPLGLWDRSNSISQETIVLYDDVKVEIIQADFEPT